MIESAILLVGGQGTRLRPLTINTPKPMLPVAGFPVTAHQVQKLKDAGIKKIVLATSYRAEVFSTWIDANSSDCLEIVHAFEEAPLGTGGAIRNGLNKLDLSLDDAVVVLNGDVLSGHDLNAQIDQFLEIKADASLHLVNVPDPSAFGLVPTNSQNFVTAFLEKPKDPSEIVTTQINAGCYILKVSQINKIATGRPVSVEREVFPQMLKSNAKVLGFVDDSYFLDLGNPMAYVQGSADLVRGVAPSSLISNPADSLIQTNVDVAPSALVCSGSTVMTGALVADNAVVSGTIVMNDASILDGVELYDCVVGVGAKINSGVKLRSVVIGDHAEIGKDIELSSGTRVWPDVVLNIR